jgi:hypothetical protein
MTLSFPISAMQAIGHDPLLRHIKLKRGGLLSVEPLQIAI